LKILSIQTDFGARNKIFLDSPGEKFSETHKNIFFVEMKTSRLMR